MAAKILVLSYDKVPGLSAAGQHLSQLIPALSERAEVDGMSVKSDDLAHIQRLGAARMMRVPTPGDSPMDRFAAFKRAAHRQLDSEGYELVVCSDLLAAQCVATHPGSRTTPMLLELFELPSQTFCERNGLRDGDGRLAKNLVRQEVATLRSCRQVVVHGESCQKQLLSLNLRPEQIHVLPYGIDTKLFAAPSIEVPADPNACVVALFSEPLLASTLDPVLALWPELPQRLHLMVISDGSPDPKLEERVQALGLERRVKLTGLVTPEQLAETLIQSDVLLCWSGWSPSLQPASPIAVGVLDGLLCGRPAVAPESEALREVLGEVMPELQVSTADLGSLAARLSELATSSALRKRLAIRGREQLHDRVHSERYLDGMIKLCRQLSGDKLVLQERESELDETPEAEPPPPIQGMPNEIAHTPVVRRPAPVPPLPPLDAPTPTPPPLDAPTPPPPPLQSTESPAPRAVGLSEEVDGAAGPGNADPWIHDTIATPMDLDDMEAQPGDGPPIPGIRSMALLDQVDPAGTGHPGEQETEIRPRGYESIPLGTGEETERVDLPERQARDLRQRLAARPRAESVSDEETVRRPAFQEESDEEEPTPVPSAASVPAPIEGVDPAHYGAGVGDEMTDRDQSAGTERTEKAGSSAIPPPSRRKR